MQDAINSIPKVLPGMKDTVKNGRARGVLVKPSRGTAAWYQQLVDYFLRRRAGSVPFWDLVQNHYEQTLWNDGKTDREILDEIRPGTIYSIVHTTESMVFNRAPKIELEGWTGVIDKEEVPHLKRLLNNEWYRDYQLIRETRLNMRDCAKFGFGVMMSTYDADYKPKVLERAARELHRRSIEDPVSVEADMEAMLARPSYGDAPEYEENYEADCRVLMDRINRRRVSNYLYMQDPDSSSQYDMKWCGRIIIAEHEAVMADPLLKNKNGLKATDLPKDMGTRGRWDMKDNPYDFVILYEIWEKMIGGGWRRVVIAKDHPEILQVVENPLWIGQPFRMLAWNDTGENVFPQSDLVQIWSLYLAQRILFTKALDGYSREMIDTLFYDKNAGVDPKELYAIGDPTVGKFVGLKTANNRPLRDIFFKAAKDPKSPEAMNLLAMIERGLQTGSGLGPNQMGNALKSGTTATESAEVATFSRARGNHKHGAAEEQVAGVAQDSLGLMAQFYDVDRVREIAGDDAAKMWAKLKPKLTPEYVKNGLRVRVVPGSMKPIDSQTKTAQSLQLLQVLSGVPMFQNMSNWPELLHRIYRDMEFSDEDQLIYTPEQMALMMQIQAAQQAGMAGAEGEGSQEPAGGEESPEEPGAAPSGAADTMQQTLGAAQGGWQA